MLHNLILRFLFGGMMMFAAGGSAIADALGGGGGDVLPDDGGIEPDSEPEGEQPAVEHLEPSEPEPGEQEQQDTEEPDVKAFKGAVSARLRALTKQAPELQQVFQKYPKLQEQIEATFRREAALREIFPTVAEARQFREHFPNGIQDVQQILDDQAEVDELDNAFYNRDGEGNYPGHQQLIEHWYQDDKPAMLNMFRTAVKEWPRLDRESYNEVLSQIFGATLAQRGIPDFVADLLATAKEAKQDGLAKGLERLLSWTESYSQERTQRSPDEERLSRERQSFQKEREETARADGQRFHNSFVASSRKLQLDIINAHPAMQKLAKVQSITPEKRQRIADEIRGRIEKLLSNSPSFMRKLRPAYQGRNLQESLSLQKAAWSQPWLLNRMVRDVLRVETPAMVEANRESIRRRAGANGTARPVNGAQQKTQGTQKPTAPYQKGNVWYKPDGRPFSMEEVLQGKHLT